MRHLRHYTTTSQANPTTTRPPRRVSCDGRSRRAAVVAWSNRRRFDSFRLSGKIGTI
jgi:hypothetical protein